MKKKISISVVVSLVLGMLATLGISTPAVAATAPSGSELTAVRARILEDTNKVRASNGLPPVVLNTIINANAQDCSVTQAQKDFMEHCITSTTPPKSYPAGFVTAGENVSYTYTADEVVAAWMDSPGHRANLLNGTFNEMGIGAYYGDSGTLYLTQQFAWMSATKSVPGAVRNFAISRGTSGSVNATFNEPIYNGNSPITSYTITATSPGQTTVTKTVTTTGTHNITGLRAGVEWTLTASANNAIGAGVKSYTETITPLAAPTITVTSSNITTSSFRLNFTVEANGGTVNQFTLTPEGRTPVTLSASTPYYDLYSLKAGTAYTGTVTIGNTIGSTTTNYTVQTKAVPPTAPRALELIDAPQAGIKATWSAPTSNGGEPVTKYIAKILNEAGDTLATNEIAGTAKSETVFTNLTRYAQYRVEVVAVNSAGASPSVSTTMYLTISSPTAPTEVTASNTELGEVTVNWKASTDDGGEQLQYYRVEVFNSKNVSAGKYNVSPTSQATQAYVVKGLTLGETYTFRVDAINYMNMISPATTSSAITVPTVVTPPTAPRNLTLDSATQNGFKATWVTPTSNGGSTITGYRWEISTSTEGIINSGTSTNPTITATNLDPYTSYLFRVTAVNKKGQSAAVTSTIKTLASAPSTPLVTSIETTSTSSVDVRVSSEKDGGDATITYTVSLYDGNTLVSKKTTTSGILTFTGLKTNTTYIIEVNAKNSAGVSASSNTTYTTPTLSSPVNSLKSVVDGDSVKTTWSVPTDAGTYSLTGYRVTYLNTDNTVAYTQQVSPLITWAEVKTSESGAFRNGKDYTVKVVPLTHTTRIEGESASASFSFPIAAPYAVKDLTNVFTGQTTKATWSAPTNNGGAAVEQYLVELYEGTTKVDSTTTTATTVTFSGIKPSTEYTITVLPSNSAGTKPAGLATVTNTSESGVPSAPTATFSVNAATAIATPKFSANNNGSAITKWEYRAYVSGTTAPGWTTVAATGATSFPVTGAKAYIVEIKAYNAAGASTVGTAKFNTPVVAPTAVRNLAVTVNNSSLTAKWAAPTTNGGANLKTTNVIVRDSSKKIIANVNLSGTATSYTRTGLSAFTNYSVEVKVINNSNYSSAVASKALRTNPSAAPKPTSYKSSISGTNMTVSWRKGSVSNSTLSSAYRVTVRFYDASTKKLVRTNVSGGTSLTVFAPRGKSYYATLQASYNGYGSTSSATVKTNTIKVAVLKPSNPSSIGITFSGAKPVFTWRAGSNNGASQRFYVSVHNSAGKTIWSGSTTGTKITAGNLTANKAYTVKIRARNSVGYSGTISRKFNTAASKPSSVRSLSGSATTNTVSYKWSAPANNGRGTIWYSYTLTSYTGKTVVSGTTGSTNFSYNKSLVRGKNYKLTVVARNSKGASAGQSVTVKVK